MMLYGSHQVVSESIFSAAPSDLRDPVASPKEGGRWRRSSQVSIHHRAFYEAKEQQHLKVMDQLKIKTSRLTASPRKCQISPPQSPSDCKLHHRGSDCETRSDRAAEEEEGSDDDQIFNRPLLNKKKKENEIEFREKQGENFQRERDGGNYRNRNFSQGDTNRAAEKLFRIRQDSSVMEYKLRFEKLHCLVDGVHEQSLLQTFLGGLQEEIRHDVTIVEPESLIEAFKVALRYEAKQAQVKKWIKPNFKQAAVLEPSCERFGPDLLLRSKQSCRESRSDFRSTKDLFHVPVSEEVHPKDHDRFGRNLQPRRSHETGTIFGIYQFI